MTFALQTSSMGKGRRLGTLVAVLVALASFPVPSHAQEDSTVLGGLATEARNMAPLVSSKLARDFLAAVPDLPHIAAPRIVYVRKETREYLSESAYQGLSDSARSGFARKEFGEDFYYYTRYGTPLAFVRPLDLAAKAGLNSLMGARIIDFGFGSIGQLRLMASLGTQAYGIEVDPLLRILYSSATDAGPISPRSPQLSYAGSINLLFGSFPTDSNIATELDGQFDVFFSKNTLKRGYIHPERGVDPRMLVHLGVDDSAFVRSVYQLLKPGGLFVIYNLHPAPSAPDKPYIPWSDGRCPFARDLLERAGFTVLSYDQDDTPYARDMARAFGWDKEMNLETDLFGTYTILRK